MPYQKNYQGGYNQAYPHQETARPVLGTQSPPSRTVLVCFADTKYPKIGIILVPMQPYVADPTYDLYDPQTELANMSGYQHDKLQMEANLVMLFGQYP